MSNIPIINSTGKATNFPALERNIAAAGAEAGNAASKEDSKSWFEAMAKAWGSALDQQAGKITQLSSHLSEHGADNPSVLTQLTAESLKMQFLSQSAASSDNAVGQALETIGRKQ